MISKSTSTGLSVLRCVNVEKKYSLQSNIKILPLFLGAHAEHESDVYALRDISMTVPCGKVVGILGRNGAGKSTLLRVLGGVYVPTAGFVEANGEVAGLFELGGTSNPLMTGRAYAKRFLRIISTGTAKIGELVNDIIEFSELGEAFDEPIRTYSSGMKARLYFSTVTAIQHEIYLIDELLSVGDEHFQAKCWQRMRARLANGASGILVTHDWSAILKLCEQAHVIEDGRFSFSGASDQAVVSYLKLAPPDATVARFSLDNPKEYLLRANECVQITFEVEILEDVAVEFSWSIEILRIGDGWEIVLLNDSVLVGEKKGRYTLVIDIPQLPLVAGEYSLNLFLGSCPDQLTFQKVAYDCRSWTYGNGYKLIVEDSEAEPRVSVVSLPYTVRKIAAEDL